MANVKQVEVHRTDLRPGDKLLRDLEDGTWLIEREWKASPIRDLPVGTVIGYYEDHDGGTRVLNFAERVEPKPDVTGSGYLEWRRNGFDLDTTDSLQYDLDRNKYGDWILFEAVSR